MQALSWRKRGGVLVEMTSGFSNTVLLVDDGLAERKLFAMAGMKARVGFQLRQAADGGEAQAYLRGEGAYADREKHPFPALVVLDVNMPGMSGFEVLEWIRGHETFGVLPVVMWTTSSNEDDIARAYSLAVNSYLVKPLSLVRLVEILRLIDDYWLKLNQPPIIDDVPSRPYPMSKAGAGR